MITITIKRPLISTKFTMNLFFMQIKRFISFTWHILSTFMDNRLLFFSIFFQLFGFFSTFRFFQLFCFFFPNFLSFFLKFFVVSSSIFLWFRNKNLVFIVLTQYYSIFITINLDSYCHFSRKDDFLPFFNTVTGQIVLFFSLNLYYVVHSNSFCVLFFSPNNFEITYTQLMTRMHCWRNAYLFTSKLLKI